MEIKGNQSTERTFSTNATAGTTQPTQPAAERLSWLNMQALTPDAPLNMASQVVKRFSKTMEEVLKELETGLQMMSITIDSANYPELPISCVVLSGVNSHQVAAYYTFLLEGSAGPIQQQILNDNGMTFENYSPVSDLYNQAYAEHVHSIVTARLGSVNVYKSHSNMVPKDFNYDDGAAVERLIMNAAKAIGATSEVRTQGFSDLNLAAVGQTGERLQTTLDLRESPIADPAGNPVRADWQVTLSVSRQKSELSLQAPTTVITQTAGFADLVYDPRGPQNTMPNVYFQQQGPSPLFTPVIVVRALETPNAVMTPSLMLLSIINAYMLADPNCYWSTLFNPRLIPQGPESDKRDIGVLGIPANLKGNPSGLGERWPTDPASMPPQQFAQLMQALVSPNAAMAIDIEETGAYTWQYKMIALAAEDQTWKEELVRAADVLTNGNFSKRYKEFGGQGTIVFKSNIRNHTGYYLDKNGNKRDIANIDFLAVLNALGETNYPAVMQWVNSYASNPMISPQRLMADRKRIIDSLVNATYTGASNRYIFEHAALDALVQGAVDAGYVPAIKVPTSGEQVQGLQAVDYARGGIGMGPARISNFGAMGQMGNVGLGNMVRNFVR